MAGRLSLADHQFIGALTAAVIDHCPQPEDRHLATDLIEEALPQVSRSHPLIGPMIEPAEGLVALANSTSGKGAQAAWSSAVWLASIALRRFHLHRAGCAREELQANTGQAA